MFMEINLKSFEDYIQRMFSSMTIRDAEMHSDFISAIYATEAFLVEKARQ